jgi:hypothetical protein
VTRSIIRVSNLCGLQLSTHNWAIGPRGSIDEDLSLQVPIRRSEKLSQRDASESDLFL